MTHEDTTYRDCNLVLQNRDGFKNCHFSRVAFSGLARRVSFADCSVTDSSFGSPLIDSVVSGCVFHCTDLVAGGKSLVSNNQFTGGGGIVVLPMPPATRREELLYVLRNIPVIGWVLYRLGMLRLPVGTIVSGNWLDVIQEKT